MAYTRVLTNFKAANTRRETLEGKEYLVVPAVMMTPGVRTGSEGPLLYLPEELGKTPAIWNHKPTTLYHPSLDGQNVSACDPVVIEQQKVGLILNAKYESKLQNECWLDEVKMNKFKEGQSVLTNIAEGKMVEVSTGLYYDREETTGTYEGVAYEGIVRNIRGDHLAILLDQVGACSIEDGGGLLRNTEGEVSYDDIRSQLRALLSAGSPNMYSYVCDVFPKYAVVERGDQLIKVGYKIKKGKVSIDAGEPEVVRRVVSYVANAKTQAIIEAAQQHYSGIDKEGDWNDWQIQLLANSSNAVFFHNNKYFRLPYKEEGDKITLNGKFIPVEPTNLETPTMANPTVTNSIHQGADSMFRDIVPANPNKATVDAIIGTGKATEADRPYLEAQTPEALTVIGSFALKSVGTVNPAVVATPTPAVQTPPTPAQVLTPAANVAPVMNASPTAPAALEPWLKNAPPEVVQMVRNAQQQETLRKKKYIQIILNAQPRFNPAWLEAQTTAHLHGMAVLANTQPPAPQQNPGYVGQGGDEQMFVSNVNHGSTDTLVDNFGDDEILQLPAAGWGQVG